MDPMAGHTRLWAVAKVLGVLVALSVAACGDDDSPGPSNKDGGGGSGGTNPGWRAAVGEDGTFVQTFDDQTWKVRQIAQVDLLAVTCVGNTSGWAVGEAGYIAHTADGGLTWGVQSAPTKNTLRAVHFMHDHNAADPRLVGIAAGDAGTVLLTVNGGAVWTLAEVSTDVALRGVTSIVSESVLLAVGDAGSVLRSANGGTSFQPMSLPEAASLTGIDSDPDGKLIVTVDADGGIWASLDLAQSFTLEHRASGALRSVSVAPDGMQALVAGDAGLALSRSPDGSWQSLALGTQSNLRAALITHAGNRAFVAGEGGTLLKADQLAGSWVEAPVGTTVALTALEDLDPH
jgi:photosystem II stability/assembly factor-like uncharacterized protein